MSAPRWIAQRERGSSALLRLMLWIALRLGWGVAQALLLPITAWFFAASPRVRAASRDYLGRVLGRRATSRDVFRHLHSFACVTLDRVFFLSGRLGRYHIETAGLDALVAALGEGRGCVLLGAHLGSFEALRSIARHSPVPVRALMYRRNAGPLTRMLDTLAPALRESVIEIGAPDTMLRVRESVARGEIVGILADRAPAGARAVEAEFLGGRAAFPAGPFLLAAGTGAPVFLFRGVRTGARRYRIEFEPFAERIVLPRATRAEDLAACVARFAARLEAGCRAWPLNWFNFYPFWEAREDAAPAFRPRPGLSPALTLPGPPAAAAGGSPLAAGRPAGPG